MILERIKSLLAPKVSTDAKLAGISLFLGKTLDSIDARIGSVSEQKLLHGVDGKDGKDGKNGRDGQDGKNGRDGVAGPKGDRGDPGALGKVGPQGVSVVDAEVAIDGNLVLTLSNGSIIDAGEIVQRGNDGSVFVSGNSWQITVSSTAPPDPQLNQLWLDIS